MSGVWEGLLSVQDSGCPQNITHAGQGTEACQDQMIHSASREGTGTLEKHDQREQMSKNNQRLFHLSCWRQSPTLLWEYFSRMTFSPSSSYRNETKISLSGEVYAYVSKPDLSEKWMCGK